MGAPRGRKPGVDWPLVIMVTVALADLVVGALALLQVHAGLSLLSQLDPQVNVDPLRSELNLATGTLVAVPIAVCILALLLCRRRCGSPYLNQPRHDLSMALGVVEGRVASEHWCQRYQQCERAGWECSSVAAAELGTLLGLARECLFGYQRDWGRERRKESPDTGKSFSDMANMAYELMSRKLSFASETRRIQAIVDGLFPVWEETDAIIVSFRHDVVNRLAKQEDSTLDDREAAAAAVSGLLERVQKATTTLGDWRANARAEMVACQREVIHA